MRIVRPGIHRTLDLNYANFGWKEKNIIRRLAKVWRITFARKARFKDADYYYAFARPTTELNNSFRLEREVLILLNKYPSFDARTLDFVDKTIFEFQNRLDKLCVILVSQDKDIREKVRLLTSQEPETRLIVPFSYDEFFDQEPEKLIMERLKEFFYGRDLFAFESPLQSDTYFFGRNNIVQFLYDKYKSGENSGLFGLRKIGKTSVLYALKRYLDFRDEYAVFLDCQEPAFHKRRWFEVLEFIIKNIVTTLRRERDIEIETQSNYTEKDGSLQFQQDLLKIHEKVLRKRLLLIFDEIENITFDISPTEHWNKGGDFILFWQSIRSIFQKNPNAFSFIVAGVNPKIVETARVNDFDNPIYRMITPIYLKFFNVPQVQEMVSLIGKYMGLEFDEEIYTHLTEDYGGHPFLIRQVCSKIHNSTPKNRPARISRYYYKKHKDEFDRSLRDYVELIVEVLRRWYPKEYELLEMLATGNKRDFDDAANISTMMVQHLEGYNLVEHSNSDYHIRIEAVEDYLKEKSNMIKKVKQIGDKWSEISIERNTLEQNLRRCVKLVIKSNYGPVKGKEEFLKIIGSTEKRKGKLEASSFDQLFTGEGEIYFEDLRKFINNHWDEFEKILGDKQMFDSYMVFVNTNRIDAHAKNIDEQNYTMLMMALDWLNKKIDSFMS
jgi:hypothetical protein